MNSIVDIQTSDTKFSKNLEIKNCIILQPIVCQRKKIFWMSDIGIVFEYKLRFSFEKIYRELWKSVATLWERRNLQSTAEYPIDFL